MPDGEFVWQDPIPEVDRTPIDSQDASMLKAGIPDPGLSGAEPVRAARAPVSTFRASDMRCRLATRLRAGSFGRPGAACASV